MGICSSCLGHDSWRTRAMDSETSRLLYEDPHHSHYGALNGDVPVSVAQADPQDLQREEAALRKIVAQTSDNFFDIFADHRQLNDASLPAALASEAESKSKRYQRLMEQIVDSQLPPGSTSLPSGSFSSEQRAWQDDGIEPAKETVSDTGTVRSNQVGELVGGFADLQGTKKASKS